MKYKQPASNASATRLFCSRSRNRQYTSNDTYTRGIDSRFGRLSDFGAVGQSYEGTVHKFRASEIWRELVKNRFYLVNICKPRNSRLKVYFEHLSYYHSHNVDIVTFDHDSSILVSHDFLAY